MWLQVLEVRRRYAESFLVVSVVCLYLRLDDGR